LVRGDDGVEVQLSRPAQRIVSLAPHLTELIYAAGAGEKLVAVSAYSDFPEAAKKLPQVGDSSNLDIERLIVLKPDLVLAWKSNISPFNVERLRRMGVPVWVSETRKLGDIAARIREIGLLTDTLPTAEKAAHDFEQRIADIQLIAIGKQTVSTFIEIWHDPLLSVNGEHIMSEVVGLCGGKNVLDHAKVLTPAIGLETLLEANPQAIIGGGSASNDDDFRRVWANHPSLRAVRNGHLFHLNPDWIQRATPRILLGAEIVCRSLAGVRQSASP
jgi:iron complex transport system substrate-binding protein